MNILITGATGFVGRNLIPILQRKHKVIAICRDINKVQRLFSDCNIELILANDMDKLKYYNPEIVIHLASYLTSKNDLDTLYSVLNSNITFGAELLDSLKKTSTVKLFMNFGSFSEYRFGPQNCNSAYLYSATKTAFKSILKYYSEICEYNYIHIVPYTIYGGRDSQKKIMDYIRESFDASVPVKMTEGEQILDFIHINDVIGFILFLLDNVALFMCNNGAVYHLGTGKGTSIRELAHLMELKYNKKCNIEWGALPYREMDIMYAVAPIGTLINKGWKANNILEDWI